ncbi:MAG: LysR family transcriptional regulator [Myxococcota bacterium]
MTSIGQDWDDLRVLLAVLEEQSLSKAGHRLGLSQPTVGRRLTELEDRVGTPLLERTTKGCVPTELGGALLPMLETMRQATDGMEQLLRSAGRSLAGRVRIACGEVVGRALARDLGRIVAGVDELQIEVIVGMKTVNLERGDADIAIRNRPPTQPNLRSRRVGRGHYAIYGAPRYVEQHPEAWTDARFEACRWVGFNEEQSVASARWLATKLDRPPSVRLSHTGLILEAVAAGAGLAVTSERAGNADPRLVQVSDRIEELSFDSLLVMHARSHRIPRVRFVADQLARHLSTTDAPHRR